MVEVESVLQSPTIWIPPLIALVLTLIAVPLSRRALTKLQVRIPWALSPAFIRSASYLIAIAGLHLVIQTSPLSARTAPWLENSAYILSIFFLLLLADRAALQAIHWSVNRNPHSAFLNQAFIPLLKNLITLFLFVTGIIMILKQLRYDVMSLVAALGVGSLAVGLAAKDTLSNMISGFMLILDRNLRPGDRVRLQDVVGDVEEIGLRSTRIKTPQGNTLIVPNADLVNTKILNLSLPNREITKTIQLKLDVSNDFDRIKLLCMNALKEVDGLVPDRSASIQIADLSEGFLLINIGFWIRDFESDGKIITEVNEKLLKILKENQIAFALPRAYPSLVSSASAL